jgi:hypothetical protein
MEPQAQQSPNVESPAREQALRGIAVKVCSGIGPQSPAGQPAAISAHAATNLCKGELIATATSLKAQPGLPVIAQKWFNISRFSKITTVIAFYCQITTDSCHVLERHARRARSERHPVFSVCLHNISKRVNNPAQPCGGMESAKMTQESSKLAIMARSLMDFSPLAGATSGSTASIDSNGSVDGMLVLY